MTNRITPVILCGGSGTRLWPLSRKSFPKQFVPLIDNKSLLQLTLERVAGLGSQVMAVASEDHRFMVFDALQAARVNGSVILEPVARNTAAAMALAALYVDQSGQPDQLLLFCPADHHVPDAKAFVRTVQQGVKAAEAGAIVTFGVVPSFPSTAYGYIQRGAARADGSQFVKKFIEKPDATKAQDLLLSGDVLWNAGIFLTRPSSLIHALELHAPDIVQAARDAMGTQVTEILNGKSLGISAQFIRPEKIAFASCRSQSIDYAVLEKHDDVAVVPFNGQWSDVGSWNAIADLADADPEQNRVYGQGVVHNSNNTFIYAPHRPVVALGTQDLLIIDTPDAVLVAHRSNAEQVKEVVDRLENLKYSQAIMHRKVTRPWGWYDTVDFGNRFLVKRIGVKTGAALSLQKHHHRAEHWIVVKGTAEVTCGSETFLLSENQSTYIPVGEIHRLHNPGMIELEMIEVQSGGYIAEDDIVRLEDTYGRTGK